MTAQTTIDTGPDTRTNHARDALDPSFVSFTDKLAEELSLIENLLLVGRAGEDAAAAAKEIYPSFARWLDRRLGELVEILRGLSLTPRARDEHGQFFRRKLWPFTRQSAFLRRTNERPRGYAGDSEMMQMLYDEDFSGTSVLGCLLHHHPIQSDAAKAVRHRIELIAELLRRREERARVLSLACGPARELNEIVCSAASAEALDIVLADQDEDALKEARAEVARVERRLGASVRATTRKLSVRDLMRGDAASSLGDFDAIYSLGLFDYLSTPVAKRLVTILVGLLRPAGSLVIGNFHVDCSTRTYLDVWMNWPLLYRTEAEMLDLTSDVPLPIHRAVEFEATRSQMFLRITRAP